MSASPDPMADGRRYREMLLGLVGDDDPIAIQRATPAQLREAVRAAGVDVRTRPADGEWSVLELIGHAVDAELVMTARYRWTLAQDEPSLIGYDQDLWVSRLRHNDADPDDLLALFGPLRKANVALWLATPEADRERVARHAERGPESYGESFRMIAGHDRFHLEQIDRTLRDVRS